eukprot:245206-Rhodomonas_salina.2
MLYKNLQFELWDWQYGATGQAQITVKNSVPTSDVPTGQNEKLYSISKEDRLGCSVGRQGDWQHAIAATADLLWRREGA